MRMSPKLAETTCAQAMSPVAPMCSECSLHPTENLLLQALTSPGVNPFGTTSAVCVMKRQTTAQLAWCSGLTAHSELPH
jgi:hypothetical protein